jgi:peptide deformylase
VSVRPITITGDPVLHTRAQPVTKWDQNLKDIIADMVDTMRQAPGVGLAAPQIGIGLQIFVWEWTDEDGILQEGAIINPTLSRGPVSRGKPDPESDLEGCLSIPDFRFPLRRADFVVLSGLSQEGTPLRIEAQGWLARIFQHEYDHLQGTLYVDRLGWRLRREARREIAEEGWAKPGLSWLPGRDDFEGSDHEAEEAEPSSN